MQEMYDRHLKKHDAEVAREATSTGVNETAKAGAFWATSMD